VVIDPPLPGRHGEELTHVVLAPRERGVSLRSVSRYPVHVYVLTAPATLEDATTIPPDAFKIRYWALLDQAD
jgi:hypothetical protein